MIFSINLNRTKEMIHFIKQGKGVPSIDWFVMDTDTGRIFNFIIHYNNNQYVYRQLITSREDIPMTLRMELTSKNAVNGVIPEEDLIIFPTEQEKPSELELGRF